MENVVKELAKVVVALVRCLNCDKTFAGEGLIPNESLSDAYAGRPNLLVQLEWDCPHCCSSGWGGEVLGIHQYTSSGTGAVLSEEWPAEVLVYEVECLVCHSSFFKAEAPRWSEMYCEECPRESKRDFEIKYPPLSYKP